MQKIIKYFLIPLFLFIIFFVFYNNVYKKVSITYWDEQAWISHGYFFELLINKDFKSPLWDRRLLQPILTDYMYGAVIYKNYLQEKKIKKDKKYDLAEYLIERGFYDDESEITDEYKQYKNNLDYFPDWGPKDFEISTENLLKKYGSKFQDTVDLLFRERRINIILLSATTVIVYFISLNCFGIFLSLLTTLLFGLNDFIIKASLRAHTEGLFLFLFNLCLLMLILFIKKRKSIYLIIFAILTGLITQTKLNGIMFFFIFNAIIAAEIVVSFIKMKKLDKNKILEGVIVGILTFLIFINTNFFIIKSPIKNTVKYYEHKNIEAIEQARDYPKNSLNAFFPRIGSIYKNILFDPYYSMPSNFLPSYLNNQNIVSSYSLMFEITFLVGFMGIFIQLLKRKNSSSNLIFIIFLLTQIIMGLYLKLDWDRYYIQEVLFFIIFSVLGFRYLWFFLLYSMEYVNKNIFKH